MFPFARGKMPENGEDNQHNKKIRRQAMIFYCIFETEERDRAMNFESGEGQKKYQYGLCPVPETFKGFININ